MWAHKVTRKICAQLLGDPDPQSSRRMTIRLLQTAVVAALVIPITLFLIASWISYRNAHELADERIVRSLDVVQEQALKVFQSTNLVLDTIEDLLANRSEAEIKADEKRLHDRLRRIASGLPEIQSIWIFGPTGQPLAITREYPAPQSTNFSQQDYFYVPRDAPRPGVYLGGIHQSVTGGQPYFTHSRGHYDANGKFSGVIELSLLPSDFSRFYSKLVSSAGLQYAMIRDDGTMLARFPPPPSGEVRLDARSGFRNAIQASPIGGFYTARSEVDNIERRFGVRRIPGFPVYTSAGIETAQIRNEWLSAMALHLIFGVPATLFLFGALLTVLLRTKRLHEEQDAREVAEVAMRQSQKMDAIGRLTGGVAHDFNNLLMIIIGNLEIAQRQLDSWTEGAQGKLDRVVGRAMQGAKRAATLTQRLLAFSRQQPLQPRLLDLNKLVADLSDFLARSLGETVSLEVVGAGGLWNVEADQAQLEAAILNLVVNARDAMPGGGKLTIETSNAFLDDEYCRRHNDVQQGQYALISVTDSGEGMPPDVIEKAFEPFFTTKPPGQGTGLGLSQVYGFVKQSGGHLKIYSELGEGTTVKLYLPRIKGESTTEEKVDPAVIGRGGGEQILVVEDDKDVRAYVVETLRDLNYEVREAGDAQQALRLLDGEPIDLLLTDVVLPGINGRQLAERVKAQRSGVKVLFMTGYSRNAIVHQGRLDAGVQLLQKPVTGEELARKVRSILDAAADAAF